MERMSEMLEVYHEALTSDLAEMGLEVDYTLEQLQEDMRDRAAYGILAIAQILPIIVAPPSELFDLDNFDPDEVKADAEHPLMTNYKNPFYQEVAGRFLTHMERVGYLSEAKERMQPVVDAALALKAETAKKTEEVAIDEEVEAEE